ncbi:MAG TPA: hypothetical protein P5079_10700, partial [Elusimicrobiota bacterium]|nr:hypothetical protein [Elusimicrobiota bacterium]
MTPLAKRHWIFLKKVTAGAVTATFLYSTLAASYAEANFWEQRRTAARQQQNLTEEETAPAAKQAAPTSSDWFSRVEPSLQIPNDSGAVVNVFRGNPDQPFIIHLQDAHGHYSAQKQAIEILRHLQTHRKVRTVALEGAWDRLPIEWLAAFPDQNIKTRVADKYFDRGDLNGEEYLALVQPAGTWELQGIENATLYKQNVATKEETVTARAEALQHFQLVQERLRKITSRLYPPALHDVERFSDAYHAQQLSFVPFTQRLIALSGRLKNPALRRADYPTLTRALDLLAAESVLSLETVSREREDLIREAGDRMPEKELSALLAATVEFRTGVLSPRQYHDILLQVADRLGQPVPQLREYARYLAAYETVDQDVLEQEIRRMERAVWNELATPPARRLGPVSRWVRMQLKLWSLELTPDDTAAYPQEKITWQEARDIIHDYEKELRLSASPLPEPGLWLHMAEKVRKYYQLAEARNDFIVDNVLRAMKDSGQRVAVLIAGGYHTPGITKRLKDRGVSYEVVRPRFTGDATPPHQKPLLGQNIEWRENLRRVMGTLRPFPNTGKVDFGVNYGL